MGLMSCETTGKKGQAAEQQGAGTQGAQTTQGSGQEASDAEKKGAGVASFFSGIISGRSTQKALADKSAQIMDVWTALRTMNGVINTLQSAQVRSGFFSAGAVNPLESLAPLDYVLDKISGNLLGTYNTVSFEKTLLTISAKIIFLIVIPLCALIAIIILWTHKDKTKLQKVFIVSVLVSLVIALAIPVSIQFANLIDNTMVKGTINTLTASIIEKGKTAENMENAILRVRSTGNSIITYTNNAKNLANEMIEDVVKYYIMFFVTYVLFPILALLGIFFLTRYVSWIILNKQR